MTTKEASVKMAADAYSTPSGMIRLYDERTGKRMAEVPIEWWNIAAQKLRNEALEEAAKKCEAHAEALITMSGKSINDATNGRVMGAEHCAIRIRALKTQTGGGDGNNA